MMMLKDVLPTTANLFITDTLHASSVHLLPALVQHDQRVLIVVAATVPSLPKASIFSLISHPFSVLEHALQHEPPPSTLVIYDLQALLLYSSLPRVIALLQRASVQCSRVVVFSHADVRDQDLLRVNAWCSTWAGAVVALDKLASGHSLGIAGQMAVAGCMQVTPDVYLYTFKDSAMSVWVR